MSGFFVDCTHSKHQLDVWSAHTQCIGDAIDVVEPRRNQSDLQDAFVVEPNGAQAIVVSWRNSGRILRHLHYVIEHHSILLGDRGSLVVLFQRPDQLGI